MFGGQLIVGYAGQQRRLYDPFQYTFLQHLRELNRLDQLLRLRRWARPALLRLELLPQRLFAGKGRAQNPWQVGTLEWTLPSPPPHHNFDVIPTVVRGPHEFANPEVKKALGRDWIGQAEVMPEERDVPVASPAHG